MQEDMFDEPAEVPKPVLGNDVPDERTTSYSKEEWNDWKWQVRNRIRSIEGLSKAFGRSMPDGVAEASSKFPLAITPYYASLIKEFSESDPVYAMSVPSGKELIDPPFLSDDPLHEEDGSPIPGLVHRYPNRALLITTSVCAMACRHCTRKRVTGQEEHCFGDVDVGRWVEYLKAHPEINDVIVSGGDPLTMPTAKLDVLLSAVRSVETVEVIRIGTRTPVVLPMRIDDELTSMLKKHHPLWINTHFNHPNEVTPEAKAACERIADAGIPLGNQSVLLKGVNDDPLVMEKLCRMLVRMRCRPYYIFSPDHVKGTARFHTNIEAGLRVMEHLQGAVGGIATPLFVVDLADGKGKVPILPNRVMSPLGDKVLLRNKVGTISEHVNYMAS